MLSAKLPREDLTADSRDSCASPVLTVVLRLSSTFFTAQLRPTAFRGASVLAASASYSTAVISFVSSMFV